MGANNRTELPAPLELLTATPGREDAVAVCCLSAISIFALFRSSQRSCAQSHAEST